MAELDRIRQLAGINEAPHGYYNSDEEALKKMINEMHKMVERIEYLSRENGLLVKYITAIGGDHLYVNELRTAAEDLARAIDEVDYGARSHLSPEN